MLLRQRLVDDGHSWMRSIIGLGEVPSPYERRFERGQVSGAHVTLVHLVVFAVVRPSREVNAVGGTITLNREDAGQARGLYPRQAGDTAGHFTVKPNVLFGASAGRVGSHDAHRCQVAWIKAQGYVQQAIEAASQQSCSGE